MKHVKVLLVLVLWGMLGSAYSVPAYAADDDDSGEFKAILKKNDCFKCHAIAKTKKGPSLKKIAAKYREKGKEAEAEPR